MALVLELPSTPWSTQSVVLDEVVYILEYQWSNREDTWYLSIYNSEELPLVQGIRLIPWTGLLSQHPQANLPSGDLVLYDVQSQPFQGSVYPTFENLQSRFQMNYFTKEELET